MSEGSAAVIPTSEETDMFGSTYAAKHRLEDQTKPAEAPRGTMFRWARRAVVLSTFVTTMIFGFTASAFASPVHVVQGDTFSALVAKHCGTNDWQNVSFPGRDKNWIYAGETIDITCAGTVPAKKTQAPAPAPVAAVQVSSGWANPLPGHTSLCNFWQWRGHYNHRGEDIPAGFGTPIHAVHSGNVQTQWNSGGGNMTIISHDGMAEVYMHQSSYRVRSGWVNAGDVIGYVGATGDASGPHLHLEIQPWGPWKGVTSPDRWLRDRGIYIGC